MISKLDKRGWLRIVEAFIGIIMITGVVLTMLSRPAVTDTTVQQETVKLEKFILDRVVADPFLRNQILAGDTSGVTKVLNSSVPAGISYYAKVCNYNEVCSLGMQVDCDVYSEEAIVSSNLTYYDPTKVKIIKLFFWHCAFPEGSCPTLPACSAGLNVGDSVLKCIPGMNSVGNYTCIKNSTNCFYENSTFFKNCASGETCSNGACGAPACADECTAGINTCTDLTHFKNCGQFDADTCLDWNTTLTSCGTGKMCVLGNCVIGSAVLSSTISCGPTAMPTTNTQAVCGIPAGSISEIPASVPLPAHFVYFVTRINNANPAQSAVITYKTRNLTCGTGSFTEYKNLNYPIPAGGYYDVQGRFYLSNSYSPCTVIEFMNGTSNGQSVSFTYTFIAP